MRDLYDAIGKIAAAAHANGDEIDENIFPDDSEEDRHGLDVFSNGTYVRFRAVPNEPRFDVECPFLFAPRLQDSYTPEELSERTDVDFASLPTDKQEAIVESVLRSDLEAAEEYEPAFRTAVQEKLRPVDADILRLGYREDDLWNGVLVRDRAFPYEESFGTVEYRQAVQTVRHLVVEIGELLTETVPPLNGDRDEGAFAADQNKQTGTAIGFQ